MNEIKCYHCGCKEVKKAGFCILNDGEKSQRYKCRTCSRSFPSEYIRLPAQPPDQICPYCDSTNTVKLGKPRKGKHGFGQRCKCKNCKRQFTLDARKPLKIFIGDKLIHSYWSSTELTHVDDVACPDCGKKNVILKSNYYEKATKRRINSLICLDCGRAFLGGGKCWRTSVYRRLEKPVPPRSWEFDDDLWDLREFYPDTNEYKLKQLFLNFNSFESDWFKKLAKKYILWRVQLGTKPSSLIDILSIIRLLGKFINRQRLTSMEQIDRSVLATYWSQDRGQLSRSVLYKNMKKIETFLSWGNGESHFTTPTNLISNFDLPKTWIDEPDPLEESVIEAIRDNLHILPEPLQLMFVLGFWLATRPSELCNIRKDCIKLDPDGSRWWVEFEREKVTDENRLIVETDLVRLIQQQQSYINALHGEDYPFLFCHYQEIGKTGYPQYPKMKAVARPPLSASVSNPMVSAIRHLIEHYNIKDSNGVLAKFTGAILRPSRATDLIRNGHSLEFVRIWLKHRHASTTKRHYTRYRPGELLDVCCVMANLEGKFYPYDSNPEKLRQNPNLHELDGLKTPYGEPLYGYCIFREFCPRFGHCYTCGFHVASADKLPLYKSQLAGLLVKKAEIVRSGSAEMLNSYTQMVTALEGKILALEALI